MSELAVWEPGAKTESSPLHRIPPPSPGLDTVLRRSTAGREDAFQRSIRQGGRARLRGHMGWIAWAAGVSVTYNPTYRASTRKMA